MKRFFFLLSAAASLFLLSGACIKMGQDFKKPETEIKMPLSYEYTPIITEVLAPQPEERWWNDFGDSELDRLVEEALKRNLDIRKSAAAILELRARFIQTRADRFPMVGFQAQGQRQHQPGTVSIPGYTFGGTTSEYNLSLPASFELDLWGRLARAEEAALADLMQAEENRRTIAQSVVAETITLYLQIEAIERRISIIEESIQNYRRSLGLVENRYERGLTSILDLRQARRTFARAEAYLPSLFQELGITQQKLAVLLGRYPKTRERREHPEAYFQRPAPVPPGLPSQLLLRRPDIKAAEAKLRALNARIGVAKASRFPAITLTGGFGYSSDELSQLVQPQSLLWNLALGLVQPLFDAGRLKAGQRAAESRYQQGIAEYAKTLLTAFSEVEKTLLTRKEQLERREATQQFFIEAKATQKAAETRYLRGLVDYLTVLEAQETRSNAAEDLVFVDLAILSNRVALHRALGGGWGRPAPVEPDRDSPVLNTIPILPMKQEIRD